MKKTILLFLLALITFNSLAVEADCSFEIMGTYADGAVWVMNFEYVTTNGNCCDPSAGAAIHTYSCEYIDGSSATFENYTSSSTAASVNPGCSDPHQYD